MAKIHHIVIDIRGLLNESNYRLGKMFDKHGANVRKELKARLAKGEKLIGPEGCEGFDPVKGCPGHIVADDSEEIKSLINKKP